MVIVCTKETYPWFFNHTLIRRTYRDEENDYYSCIIQLLENNTDDTYVLSVRFVNTHRDDCKECIYTSLQPEILKKNVSEEALANIISMYYEDIFNNWENPNYEHYVQLKGYQLVKNICIEEEEE